MSQKDEDFDKFLAAHLGWRIAFRWTLIALMVLLIIAATILINDERIWFGVLMMLWANNLANCRRL